MINDDESNIIITLSSIEKAHAFLLNNKYAVKTPLVELQIKLDSSIAAASSIWLKLESLQISGSFKMRGVAIQFHHLDLLKEEEINDDESSPAPPTALVTMSAGNYGKSFALMSQLINERQSRRTPVTVCMPTTVPAERVAMLKSYGASVKQVPSPSLKSTVDEIVLENPGTKFLHPFDDESLMVGYGTIALEMLEANPLINVIIVPCGGGGLLAGVAHALRIKSAARDLKIIGVEPDGAPGQYVSRKNGVAATSIADIMQPTIASGLAPPFAGKTCFEYIQRHVDDIVLVSDDEIKAAMKVLFAQGIVSEPSGAAALAALQSGKVSISSESVVACVISGRNVSNTDFASHTL